MPGYTLAPGADSRAIAAVLDGVEREAREAGAPPATVDRVDIGPDGLGVWFTRRTGE